jgi:hypothetical protein
VATPTVHIVKLCVGISEPDELAAWQKKRWNDAKKAGRKPECRHITRNTPKRAAEIIEGGSLYWVIKGVIRVRQRIIDVKPVVHEGEPRCKLVLHRKLVRVMPRPMRAFQGWRYLEATSAPPDLDQLGKGAANMPPKMVEELRELGLL